MRRHLLWITVLASLRATAQEYAVPKYSRTVTSESARVTVRMDADSQVMSIRAGPFSVEGMEMPEMTDMPDMPDMPMEHRSMKDHILFLTVPADVYLTGYEIAPTDANGAPLPREYLHHAGIANLGRRELLHPAYERLAAAGKETATVRVPPAIGIAMRQGDSLGIYIGLHGPHGVSIHDAYVTFRLFVVPAHQRSHPTAIYPLDFQINFAGGGTTAYDLPPGRSQRSEEFVMPLSARLIALGAHMHDYARYIRLSECATGKELVTLKAHRRADGTISGLDRFVFGFRDYGLPLERGVCYRVTAVYDNPTGRIVRGGGMASIAGPLLIDDARDWPTLDLRDPRLAADRDSL